MTLVPQTSSAPPFTLEIHLHPADWAAALEEDARKGLTAELKELPPKWLYDERGCALFEEITRLPEYYLTRRERALLRRHTAEIAERCPARTLIELGSGSSEKTRLLLDALSARGRLERYVPLDVSEPTLTAAAMAVAREYPGLAVHGVVADFERHLTTLPRGGRRLIAFLGGTIGNLKPASRAILLRTLTSQLDESDALLLGADLLKDRRRLHRAYDDRRGVTAEFNLNLLAILNRRLSADFRRDLFVHEARFDEAHRWIEMLLRAKVAHTVRLRALGLEVRFAEGEALRTEVSAKFTPEQLEQELCAAGLALDRLWLDDAGDFALLLAGRFPSVLPPSVHS